MTWSLYRHHHELIAGHNLEFFSNARYRTYRDYDTPFWVEGWSLYWELLLYQMHFAQKPEDKIGMLFWRMHRCARIIFSFNYHMGKWTPQQFHDAVMQLNCMPVEMIRAILTKQPLEREYTTKWRFNDQRTGQLRN